MAVPTVRRRLASLLYESLVVVAILLLVVALFSLVTMAVPVPRSVLLGLSFVCMGGYFAYCWHNGQTLAMRAWKIRIEDPLGRPPSWGRSCMRYVFAWVWIAPPLALMAAVKPAANSFSAALGIDAAAVIAWIAAWSAASLLRADRQFWHDAASGTRIVAA